MNKWQIFGKTGALKRWLNYNNEIDIFLKKKFNFREKIILARLCGFLAGDGSLIKRNTHYEIKFLPDNLRIAKIFQKDFNRIFGKKLKIEKERNYYCLRTKSKKAYLRLLTLGSFGCYRWSVPTFILKNKKLKVEWVRAFFDCEAYVHKRRMQIQLQSVNCKGLTQIKKLLNSLGIESKIYRYDRKRKNWSTNYILCILGHNVQKYINLIGFNHTKKMRESIKKLAKAGVAELG